MPQGPTNLLLLFFKRQEGRVALHLKPIFVFYTLEFEKFKLENQFSSYEYINLYIW